MKKYFVWPIAVLLSMFSTNAQYVMKVTMKSGDVSEFNVSEIEDVTWQEQQTETHEYVDLGLSVKWATCNVGASSPEDYGDYYAWGETETKSTYNWSTYKWCKGSKETQTKYCTDSYYGTVDIKMVLESSDDVAHVKWGGSWCMPTDTEMTELRENCTWTWTTQGGKNGYKVTSKKNGNSIFLPAAGVRLDSSLGYAGSGGLYWSSSLSTSSPYNAWGVYFDSSNVERSYSDRYYGRSVRPVYSDNDLPSVKVTEITLDKSFLSLTEGENYTLSATVSPSNASDKSVTWSSSNSSVATVSASGVVTAVKAGTTTITGTANDGSDVKATCTVTVVAPENTEGEYNGHKYVDLGLSVKWATCNVGASSPEEYGDYYAWGETETKSTYDWSTYKWCNGYEKTLTKYCTESDFGTVDNKTEFDPEDDVAQVKWGGSWRMPTEAEMTELRENCTWAWTTQSGKNGYKVTSKKNGNSIFLPAAGYCVDGSLKGAGSRGDYWSSSLKTIDPSNALYMIFNSSDVSNFNLRRYYGRSVRPVCSESDLTSVKVTNITLDKSTLSLFEDETYTLSATVSPSNATDKSVTWSSSNSSVAMVSTSGVVTAVNAGTATIKVKANDGSGVAATCSVTVIPSENIEGEYNGHEYVDLGLSVKWATCNVGAFSPEEYGNYYAWGETETKDTYNWSTYKWCNGGNFTQTKYCTNSSFGMFDKKTVLESSDDVARVKWGGNWRMPTNAEMTELRGNCTWEWTTLNGKNGYKVTSKKNGKSIFLPAAGERNKSSLSSADSNGYYWSSSLNGIDPDMAYHLDFNSSKVDVSDIHSRCLGLSVRPVCP